MSAAFSGFFEVHNGISSRARDLAARFIPECSERLRRRLTKAAWRMWGQFLLRHGLGNVVVEVVLEGPSGYREGAGVGLKVKCGAIGRDTG